MIIRTLIPVEEAEAGLSRIIEQMRQGEEIVLLKDGIEIARISSLRDQAPAEGSQAWREQGGLAGLFAEIDPDWWKPDDEMADLFEGSDSFEGARGN